MNPPGGMSLLIHIFIIIFAIAKRVFKYVAKELGVKDSTMAKGRIIIQRPFKNQLFQRTMSTFIIISMFSFMMFTFVVLIYGVVSNENNIDIVVSLASLVKKIF